MTLKARFEIRRLERQVEIGCADDEHGVSQPIVVTIRVTLDSAHFFAGEVYAPPYDYCRAIQAVDDAIASRPRFVLQETLFVAIAARVLADPVIEDVEIELAKTARYDGCEQIGMTARVTRADLAMLASRYAEDPAVVDCARRLREAP